MCAFLARAEAGQSLRLCWCTLGVIYVELNFRGVAFVNKCLHHGNLITFLCCLEADGNNSRVRLQQLIALEFSKLYMVRIFVQVHLYEPVLKMVEYSGG